MLRVSCGFDCGYWCQMNTDGPELFFLPQGPGPAPGGAALGANIFIYLSMFGTQIPADPGLNRSGQED